MWSNLVVAFVILYERIEFHMKVCVSTRNTKPQKGVKSKPSAIFRWNLLSFICDVDIKSSAATTTASDEVRAISLFLFRCVWTSFFASVVLNDERLNSGIKNKHVKHSQSMAFDEMNVFTNPNESQSKWILQLFIGLQFDDGILWFSEFGEWHSHCAVRFLGICPNDVSARHNEWMWIVCRFSFRLQFN